MAVHALPTCMSVLKLEAGLVVIEVPIPPIAGVVTGFAIGAEAAHVYVLLLVAGPAIGFGVLESDRNMTFAACDQGVQPGQRKTRHPVIKFRIFP